MRNPGKSGLLLGALVLLEELFAFGGELAGVSQGLRDRLSPGVGGEGEAGGCAFALHGSAGVGEMTPEEGTFAAHLLRGVGGALHSGAKMRAILAGERFAPFNGEATLRIFLRAERDGMGFGGCGGTGTPG